MAGAAPWRMPVLCGLLAAGVVLACAWPLPLHPGSRMVGDTQADFYGIAWGLDHAARALAQGQFPPLHTDRLEFPRGATLLLADLPEAVLLAPFTLAFGATAAFNLLQVLHHALAAAAAAWCARRAGLGGTGQAVAGLAFGFAPAMVGMTFNQNPDVTPWYWVPLAAGLALGASDARRAGLAGACAGLAAWFNPYGGVMAAAAVLLLLPGRDPRRHLAALAALLLIGGGAAALQLWALNDPHGAVMKPAGVRTDKAVAALFDLVDPWGRVERDPRNPATRIVHPAYLGWSLLAAGLPALALQRRWRWLLLFGASILMSLGPQLTFGRDLTLPNPLWIPAATLGLDRLWHYYRYTALGVLVLGLGAGLCAERLGRRGWLLLPLVLADLLLLGQGGRRLGAGEPYDDGACALLRSLPPGPVFDTPPGDHEIWLFASACHGNPVAQGINRPHGRRLNALLTRSKDVSPTGRLATLRREGFRYLVFHPTAPGGAVADPLVEAAAACRVAGEEGGVEVLDLTDCPAVPD